MNTTSLSGQIDLLALVGAAIKSVDGQECIVIPKNSNPSIFVFTTKQGAPKAYLDIVVRESPNNQFGNTHFVKANVGKSNRERFGISREDLPKYAPIIGNLKTFESAPQQTQPQEAVDIMEDLPEDTFQGF